MLRVGHADCDSSLLRSSHLVLLLAFCVAVLLTPVRCFGPCSSNIVTLTSGQTRRIDRSEYSGCGGALVFEVADASWVSSSYDVVDVDVLPRFFVNVNAVENVSIVYRDIVVDAAAMVGIREVLVGISSAHGSNVNITFHNVTIAQSVNSDVALLDGLVRVTGSASVGVFIVDSLFRFNVTSAMFSFSLRAMEGAPAVTFFLLLGSTVDIRGAANLVYARPSDGSFSHVNMTVADSALTKLSCSSCNLSLERFSSERFFDLAATRVTADVRRCFINISALTSSCVISILPLTATTQLPSVLLNETAMLVIEWVVMHVIGRAHANAVLFEKRRCSECVIRFRHVRFFGSALQPTDAETATRSSSLLRLGADILVSFIEIENVTTDQKLLSKSDGETVSCFVATADGAVTQSLLVLRDVHVTCDIGGRNYSVDTNSSAAFATVSQRVGVVLVDTLNSTNVSVFGATVNATVGCGLPSSVVTAAVASSIFLLSVRSEVRASIVNVRFSTVRVHQMDFSWARVSNAINPVCIGAIVGYNATAIVAVLSDTLGQSICGLPASSPQVILSRFYIADCLVDNPYASGKRIVDTATVFALEGLFKNSSVAVYRSFSSVAPLVILGCSLCSVRLSTIEARDSAPLVASIICAAGACRLEAAELLLANCSFASPQPALQQFAFLRAGKAVTVWPEMPITASTSGVNISLVNSSVSEVTRSNVSSPAAWDESSSLAITCTTLNGRVLTDRSAASAYPPRAHIVVGCSNDDATESLTAVVNVALQKVDAVLAGSGAAVLLVASLTSVGAMGTFSLMHSSVSSLRLRLRCASESTAGSHEGDVVGSAVFDNPMQIAIGVGDMAYTSGAVVGNTVVVVGWGGVNVAVLWVYRHCAGRSTTKIGAEPLAAVFVAATPMLCAVLQPSVAAAITLIVSAGISDTGHPVLGGVGTLVFVLPVSCVSWATWVRFPLTARARNVPAGRLAWLVTHRSQWAVRGTDKGSSATAATQRARRLLQFLRPLLEPYRAGRAWMAAAELWLAVAQAVCTGVAAHLVVKAKGCTAADASLWTMLVLGTAVLVAVVLLQPYAAPVLTAQSVAMYVLSSVTLLLSALGKEQAAAAVCIVQACWSLLPTLLQLVVFCISSFFKCRCRPAPVHLTFDAAPPAVQHRVLEDLIRLSCDVHRRRRRMMKLAAKNAFRNRPTAHPSSVTFESHHQGIRAY